MELTNINGNTYYIKGGTNTGVVCLDNDEVLLIDPGLGGTRPKRILKLIEDNNLKIRYIINSHEHDDHYEGCIKLKEMQDDIQIMSSPRAKLLIDNSYIGADYILGGKRNKFLKYKEDKSNKKSSLVDKIIQEGSVVLNNNKIEIIKLKGHTEGSIGILTEDKVLFVGDLFVPNHIIDKFDLLLLYDVKEYLDSIDKINNIDFEYIVLGHSKEVYSRLDINEIMISHKYAINKYLNQIREILRLPTTIDDMLAYIINTNELTCNYTQYQYFRSSIVCMISYLCELDEISYVIESGKMLYYSKNS